MAAKVAAIHSMQEEDYRSAEKKEIEYLASQVVYQFTNDAKNIIVQHELSYQKLCRALEIEGVSVKCLTVMEFESAISLISSRNKPKQAGK